MNPDYQMGALYGDAPNTAALDATMLNPSAAGPDDWTTILTNGISGAAVNGINGAINNAIIAGQIQNAKAAGPLMARSTGIGGHGGVMPLLLIAALLYVVVK